MATAKQITAVRTRRVKGAEEITHLGEAHRGGMRWLTEREVVEAIEQGERFYMQVGNESLLLSVQKTNAGRQILSVGFEPNPGRLLSLPRG